MKKTLGFIWGIIFFEILMITLVSSQKSLPQNISAGSLQMPPTGHYTELEIESKVLIRQISLSGQQH